MHQPNGNTHVVDIADDVVFGPDCKVWSYVVICPGVRMGARCVIGSKVYVGRDTVLGDDCRIQDGAHLTDHMSVGSRVFIGALVVSMTDKYPRVNNPNYHVNPPIIHDDVNIGCGAVILPGVVLGPGCTVGAGAVVTKDVAPGMIVAGNPARPLRQMRAFGPSSSLNDDLGLQESLCTCRACINAHIS